MSRESGSAGGAARAAGLSGTPAIDSATGGIRASDGTEQRGAPAGVSDTDRLALGRQEVGSAADSSRHKPYVTENDSGAPVQGETSAPNDVPVLPANASGSDAVTTGEQAEPIDDESMYDRRTDRDKNQPPSER
jgi:hypothetical protein